MSQTSDIVRVRSARGRWFADRRDATTERRIARAQRRHDLHVHLTDPENT